MDNGGWSNKEVVDAILNGVPSNHIGATASGQLFLRGPMTEIDGKKVFMVVGVVGVSEEEATRITGETQYTIKNIELVNPVDRTEMSRGMNADNLLTSPIWKI